MNKPPDDYRCLKIPITKIFPNDETMTIIQDAVYRTNGITSKTYFLLRL